MKRLIVTGCSLALFAVTLMPGYSAAQSTFDTNVGCGLGNMILKEKDTTVFQVLAVTTNGTFGNQTFGISSGTLGCTQPTRFVYNERLNKFVADNMDTLAMDIAAGEGEALSALTELMNVPADKKASFKSILQSSFKKIYTSDNIQSADVIDNIADIKASL